MNKLLNNKLILFPILMIMGIIFFYEFMTYDRNYTLSKEYYFEIQNINGGLNFEIQEPVKIDPKKIKLSKEKSIKLKIQKLLSKVGLMNYGSEYGEKIILNSTDRNRKIIFKSWCLSDHLIGIEIEHNNLDPSSLEKVKNLFEVQFSNYEIIWNKI